MTDDDSGHQTTGEKQRTTGQATVAETPDTDPRGVDAPPDASDSSSERMPGIDPNHFGREPDPDVPNPSPSTDVAPHSDDDPTDPREEYPFIAQLEADMEDVEYVSIDTRGAEAPFLIHTALAWVDYAAESISFEMDGRLRRVRFDSILSYDHRVD